MFKQAKLVNGINLITAPVKGTKAATILIMVGAGSKYESRGNNGISHFLEHMFFKGTSKRPTAIGISSELDKLGCEFNAFTSKEYSGYWIKVDANNFAVATDILSDMLINSKFAADEIEREKGVIVEEVNMYEDNPMMHIEDIFEDCLYGDIPAGWETIGSKENIKNFNRDNFTDYFGRQYNAKNTIICLAGNVNSRMAKIVEKYMSGFKSSQGFREKEPVRIKPIAPKVKLSFKQTDQAHISLGVHTPAYNFKDKMAIKFLSIVLGGSMSSRLFFNLRERNGLAYYVRTGTEFYSDSGYLATTAGVPVNKANEAIKIILSEYKKISTELITKEELERNIDLISGRTVIQLEASDNIANWYGRQAVMNLTLKRMKQPAPKIETPEEFLKKIRAIKPADVRKAAKEIFQPKNLNLAIIGPFKEGKEFEKILKLK
jgi:predicted Zn-dependent peptidase